MRPGPARPAAAGRARPETSCAPRRWDARPPAPGGQCRPGRMVRARRRARSRPSRTGWRRRCRWGCADRMAGHRTRRGRPSLSTHRDATRGGRQAPALSPGRGAWEAAAPCGRARARAGTACSAAAARMARRCRRHAAPVDGRRLRVGHSGSFRGASRWQADGPGSSRRGSATSRNRLRLSASVRCLRGLP